MEYANGKIYQILNNIDDDVYVGSTCQSLSQRMAKHRWSMKNNIHKGMLNDKIKEHGIDAFYIELLEEYPCDNKEQLLAREGHYIRLMGTLNKRIAGRTRKLYYEEHIEQVKEYKQTYREANSDKIREHQKQHYEENKDRIREQNTYYRETHKDEIKARKQIYQEKHKGELTVKAKKYYEEHKEDLTVKKKQYYEEHKE